MAFTATVLLMHFTKLSVASVASQMVTVTKPVSLNLHSFYYHEAVAKLISIYNRM
jgi:hypothetical protein